MNSVNGIKSFEKVTEGSNLPLVSGIKSSQKVTEGSKLLLVKVTELPKYEGRGMSTKNDTPGDLND
jgi:hypothetical protein